MGWDVPGGRSKYPTKYRFDGGTREQFKLIVGEYCRMETEKDDRQYGSLLDSLARLQAGSRIEPRWAESMKFVTSFLELGEYASIGGSAMLLDAVVSPEQRNGYLAQVEYEVRHSNQLGYLKKYFASQYYDPSGFTGARGHRHGNPLFWSNRQQAGKQPARRGGLPLDRIAHRGSGRGTPVRRIVRRVHRDHDAHRRADRKDL
jgi:methane monooxygenase component A alpha chain